METPIQARDRNYLFKDVSTRLTTVNIGSLSQFEMFFGVLWGHGKQEHELNESEKEWRYIWTECRKAILDNGNAQLRMIQQIFSRYKVEQQKQTVEMGGYVDNKYVPKKHPIIIKEDRNGQG